MTRSSIRALQQQTHYRISEIVRPDGRFPISASSWWAGVRSGLYPQPLKLGPRITVWRSVDLEKLAQHGVSETSSSASNSNGGKVNG
jgi:predicted DNA-binding transcriptional regulator AlpA